MKAVFINGKRIPYPAWIVQRWKTIETRQRNMLSAMVGERVAIAETGRNKKPVIIGYVDIVSCKFCPAEEFDKYRRETMIPAGSEFDVKGKGKYLYFLANAEPCEPYLLPDNAIRHGRSWCEF